MELDNIKKHCERLVKQIDLFVGKGKGKEILADFLSGRPRIGRKVEFIDGKLITYMGVKNSCGCFAVKGG
ncbi:hypothetical protein [Brassicibacter mesophilus]|uniref:hypothetical protein n=1 Tax=Brassicibacter mesophilus TaxID=745119 RepID=UPI003D232EA6